MVGAKIKFNSYLNNDSNNNNNIEKIRPYCFGLIEETTYLHYHFFIMTNELMKCEQTYLWTLVLQSCAEVSTAGPRLLNLH